jgi:hypothetical protein
MKIRSTASRNLMRIFSADGGIRSTADQGLIQHMAEWVQPNISTCRGIKFQMDVCPERSAALEAQVSVGIILILIVNNRRVMTASYPKLNRQQIQCKS